MRDFVNKANVWFAKRRVHKLIELCGETGGESSPYFEELQEAIDQEKVYKNVRN